MSETDLIRALEKLDNIDCPAMKRSLGTKPCPSCGNGPRDGCPKDALAEGEVVRAARALVAAHQSSEGISAVGISPSEMPSREAEPGCDLKGWRP